LKRQRKEIVAKEQDGVASALGRCCELAKEICARLREKGPGTLVAAGRQVPLFCAPLLLLRARIRSRRVLTAYRSSLLLQLPDFVADVRVQVGHMPLVNPIERDAIGGELECLLDWDAREARLVGAPRREVPSSRAIWKRVRMSARRVRAKRAPMTSSEVSCIPRSIGSCGISDTETNFAA
jgi:hypothetical protein